MFEPISLSYITVLGLTAIVDIWSRSRRNPNYEKYEGETFEEDLQAREDIITQSAQAVVNFAERNREEIAQTRLLQNERTLKTLSKLDENIISSEQATLILQETIALMDEATRCFDDKTNLLAVEIKQKLALFSQTHATLLTSHSALLETVEKLQQAVDSHMALNVKLETERAQEKEKLINLNNIVTQATEKLIQEDVINDQEKIMLRSEVERLSTLANMLKEELQKDFSMLEEASNQIASLCVQNKKLEQEVATLSALLEQPNVEKTKLYSPTMFSK